MSVGLAASERSFTAAIESELPPLFKVVFLRKAKIFLASEEATGLADNGGAAGRGGAVWAAAAEDNDGAAGRGGAVWAAAAEGNGGATCRGVAVWAAAAEGNGGATGREGAVWLAVVATGAAESESMS